jgi:hypothetical protein
MHYEINVAFQGKHFFATHERSIRDENTFHKVFDVIDKKFPESEGYTITATLDEETCYILKKENIRTQIKKLKKEGLL